MSEMERGEEKENRGVGGEEKNWGRSGKGRGEHGQ